MTPIAQISMSLDESLLADVSGRFDLRRPNEAGIRAVVEAIEAHDPESNGHSPFPEVVADLATGVGKTYLMAGMIDYAAHQGVCNVLIVTPGDTIQRKTVEQFSPAGSKRISGGEFDPVVITPENYRTAAVGTALRDAQRLKVFIFNIHQLIKPTAKTSRGIRDVNENIGADLYSHLQQVHDLLVIADEHHVYRSDAKAYSAAIRTLDPVALVGLTATPDPADRSRVVFHYTLGEAIAEEYVKTPVIAYRKDGIKDERTQLRDACQILAHKAGSYAAYIAARPGAKVVNPILFVVAKHVEHAEEVAEVLSGPGFIGDAGAVLVITNQSSEEALKALAGVEWAESPVRAIVSVNKLREGWDVKNIAVIVALRKLASQTFTEQILGRGLRLPFGARTGVKDVDQVDLVAHDSYQQLLAQKDVLRQRPHTPSAEVKVDETGAAVDLPASLITPTTGTDTGAGTGTGTGTGTTMANPEPLGSTESGGLVVEPGTDEVSKALSGVGITLRETTETSLDRTEPILAGRAAGAPQVVFPRRSEQLGAPQFSLSDISDADVRAAGAEFTEESTVYVVRDALVGEELKVSPQQHLQVKDQMLPVAQVRSELLAGVLSHDLVSADAASRGAAERIVTAFLAGAGVNPADQEVTWGSHRAQNAVEGIVKLVAARYKVAPRRRDHVFTRIELPVEPVVLTGEELDAYNSAFTKGANYTGWARDIMPVASFDAKTTEFELAQLIDRDPAVAWWLRVYVGQEAYIPAGAAGRYYPDFIVLDQQGTWWVIEAKSDARAEDPDVVAKREVGTAWARAVRDSGQFGTWRYLFATESVIDRAGASWSALVSLAKPE